MLDTNLFFGGWAHVTSVCVVGVSIYLGLIFILRVSGKRTLSKMNAFDFVVTVAFGSILATTMLNRDVSWADGVTALVLLVTMQFIITTVSTRWRWFRGLIASEPTLLISDGHLLKEAMKRQRVTEAEVLHALRDAGLSGPEAARALILETDGRFSTITANSKSTRGTDPEPG